MYILSYLGGGFLPKDRLPSFNHFQCFEVLSGFQRLPGLTNLWKLIYSITDAEGLMSSKNQRRI